MINAANLSTTLFTADLHVFSEFPSNLPLFARDTLDFAYSEPKKALVVAHKRSNRLTFSLKKVVNLLIRIALLMFRAVLTVLQP